MVLVGLLAFGFGLLALPARATYGARTTADEPQYLLSALSLWEDLDLDITDELADERWRDFHEAQLPVQTEPNPDGREISPHDPLLPVVLAVPVGLGGWAGAKVALALMAGGLAAVLVWTAHRRLAVPVPTAALVVGAAAVSPPLAAYATQVYPELPAALAVGVAFGAVTGPLGRRGRVVLVLAVVALPWLAVKYVPVAAALAAVGLWRLRRSGDAPAVVRTASAFVALGVVYVVAHRVLYGGWTVYAAGDHFVNGDLDVVGFAPDYAGRSRRLLGLLVDRDFGLLRWAPFWVLAVPALAAVARRRPAGAAALGLPLAAGWATATWVALTMHGWWWPGRQVVVVLPLAVLAVAWWVAQVPRAAHLATILGAVGAFLWAWLLVDVVVAGDRRLIIDFAETGNPFSQAWRLALPELRTPLGSDWARYAAWLVALAGAAVLGWRSVAPAAAPPPPISRHHPSERIPLDVPA
jgi:hypothetical protein